MARRRGNHSNQQAKPNEAKAPKGIEDQATTLLAAEVPSKKWRNWWIRTITTLIMISMFFVILASGYIWSIIMVMIITVLVYREVIDIASAKGDLRWYKTMSW